MHIIDVIEYNLSNLNRKERMKMQHYFNAINCFTDASKTNINGIDIVCAGYAVVYQNQILDSGLKVVYDATSMYGEELAIYMGMDALLSYAKYDTFLNLFSDSQIGIFSLRKWIFSWIKKNDTSLVKSFIKSDGTLVANQELLTAIVGLINATGVHTSLYHIRGHMNPHKVSDMKTFIEAFARFNNENMTEDIARELIYYNDVVDRATRDHLFQTIESPEFNPRYYRKPRVVFNNLLNYNILMGYKELIGLC